MTKVKDILVITGHGQGPVSYDPGAVGNGTSEAKFLREVFVPAMKKFAPSNMRFHTGRDVFAWRDARTIKADEIIELHLDAGVAAAEDGHIIIYSKFNPDDIDNRSVSVIKSNVGIRYGGISKRNNLYNLNKFAERGISYRLIELAFITNKKEMDYMFANVDKYAKELVEATLNAKTTIKEPVKVDNVYTVVKGETLWSIGRKFNVTVKDLKSWNSLKSDLIVIGQKLTLRGAKDLTPVTEKEPPNAPIAKPTPTKSIDTLVKETLAGIHGNGDARKKSLGSNYDAVMKVINGSYTPKRKRVYLPKSAKTWRVYKTSGPYTVGKEVGLLAPAQYGGLDYEIIKTLANDVYEIKTGAFGSVAIYAAKSTGATIR